MLRTELKPKTCTAPGCTREFLPFYSTQVVCGPVCASRKVRKAKLEERQSVRLRKESIQTIPKLLKEAQIAFNAFIRERDREKPCICCGKSRRRSLIMCLFGLSVMFDVIEAEKRFNEMLSKMPPDEANQIRADRLKRWQEDRDHKKALEIAEAGRARNFWGK